jgi:hypothetical protein
MPGRQTRKKRGTHKRSQHGGQGRLPIFEKITGEYYLPSNLDPPEPAPLPPPVPTEAVPPSSLEFQIFFQELDFLIKRYKLTPIEVKDFISVLSDLSRELYLNSDELIRVLNLYKNNLSNKVRDVNKLARHVRFLKRGNRL